MLARDIDVFEAKARELILDAIKISGKKDLVLRLPQSKESSSHHLLQEALVSFIGITKILIFFFRHMPPG